MAGLKEKIGMLVYPKYPNFTQTFRKGLSKSHDILIIKIPLNEKLNVTLRILKTRDRNLLALPDLLRH